MVSGHLVSFVLSIFNHNHEVVANSNAAVKFMASDLYWTRLSNIA